MKKEGGNMDDGAAEVMGGQRKKEIRGREMEIETEEKQGKRH